MDQKDNVVLVPEALADFIPQYLELRKTDITQLDAALSSNNFAFIQKICHGIKGHARGYGFLKLQEIVIRLEECALKADHAACKQLLTDWRTHFDTIKIEIQKDT